MFEDCRQFFSIECPKSNQYATRPFEFFGQICVLNSLSRKVRHFYYSPEKTILPVGLGEFFNDSGIAGVQNTRAWRARPVARVATVSFFRAKRKKKDRLVF